MDLAMNVPTWFQNSNDESSNLVIKRGNLPLVVGSQDTKVNTWFGVNLIEILPYLK